MEFSKTMKKRIVTKIGDVFSVKIDEKTRKFFQLIAYDLTQLNSDVIRAFKRTYSYDEMPKMSEIVKGEVAFYAHCVTRAGIKFGYWEKVGRCDFSDTVDHIIFRDTEDYATMPGEHPITVSNNWYIWRIGDADFTDVGRLVGENRMAEIGLVFEPQSIVHRIRTGSYPWDYPDFE